MRSLSVIYSTASGHTEFVVDTLVHALGAAHKDLRISKQRAELSKPEDLSKADILVLACGSWNTGNIEGQLSPYMFDLLINRAADVDLQKMPAAAIGLGDERYFYTARAAEKLTEFLTDHHATILLPTLKIINEPFDQVSKIEAWCKELSTKINALPASAN